MDLDEARVAESRFDDEEVRLPGKRTKEPSQVM